eukprot:235626_1
MSSENSILYTLPVAIVSALITLITSYIAIFIVHHFATPEIDESLPPTKCTLGPSPTNSQMTSNYTKSWISMPANSPRITSAASATRARSSSRALRPKKIFTYLSSSIAIFNALNTAFNTVYCVWLVVDPPQNDELFIFHPSHTQRVTSTVSWYIAKILFVWMLCFRLYHSFKGSVFRVDKRFILFLSITNTIVAPVGLCIAYWAVYTQQHQIIEELAFNVWRILYQVTVFVILYMFCKRLLQLVVNDELFIVMKAHEKGSTTLTCDGFSLERQQSMRISDEFLEVITRHSLLILTVSMTVAMTTFCFAGFRFIFLPQTCMTLLIPMNMAAVDSLVTSVCVLCLFPLGGRVYSVLCRCPNACLKKVCSFCAKRTIY